jgi:exosome complex RNA-binding protein Rrp42 (RNase PH superfamily)
MRGRDLDISNNERAFILQALKEGIRLDGRGVEDFRDLNISFGPNYGTVHLTLGGTRIFTTVSAEIVRPFPESPNEGQLVFNAEIAPVATAKRPMGRASEEEMLINRMLERCLKRSRAVDTEGLTIVAGSKVRTIAMLSSQVGKDA